MALILPDHNTFVDLLRSRLTVAYLGPLLESLAIWTGGVLVLVVICEWLDGASRGRYASRHFINDFAFRLFYIGGFHRALFVLPLGILLGRWFTVPHWGWLAQAPLAVAVPVAIVLPDFIAYWVHRFQHSRVWWRFHVVHHSQERLTFFTNSRHHPFDILFSEPVTLLLVAIGAPTITWLPYRLFTALQGAFGHAELRWTFGPIGRVIVSPVFHSVHHSRDAHDHDCNYGAVFTVWDHLFGTASSTRERPARTGVEGYTVPEFMPLQVIAPIADLVKRRESSR